MMTLPTAFLTVGVLGISAGAGGSYYLQTPPSVGIPVWVTDALATQHDDNAKLYQRIEQLTTHLDQLASQLVSQQNSQQAATETVLRRIDVMLTDNAQRAAVRDANKANLRNAADAYINESRKH